MGRAALTCAPTLYEQLLSIQGGYYGPIQIARPHKEVAVNRALQFEHLKVVLNKQKIIGAANHNSSFFKLVFLGLTGFVELPVVDVD